MNKKFILPAILIVAVLAGLGYYYGGESLQGRFDGISNSGKITKTVSAVSKSNGVGQGTLWEFDEHGDIGQWTLTLGSKQYIESIEINDGMSPLSLSELKLSIDGTEVATIANGETVFDVGQEYRAGDHTVVVSGMVEESYYQNALSGFGETVYLANVIHGADSSTTSETSLETAYGNEYYLFIDSPKFTAGSLSSSANLANGGVIYSFVLDLDDSNHKPENIVFKIDSSRLSFASGTSDYGDISLYSNGELMTGATKDFDPSEDIYAFRMMKRNLTDGATYELRANFSGLSSGSVTTTFNATRFSEKRMYTTDGTTDEDYYYCYSSSFTTCFYPFLDSDYYLTKSYTVSHSTGSSSGAGPRTGTKVTK